MTTSRAKIAANRRNAARSTGPRTAAGKARSRRNAFLHGLSVSQKRSDAYANELAALTDTLIAMTGVAPDIARSVAAARLEVLRVRRATVGTINRHRQEQHGGAEKTLSDAARAALAIVACLPTLVSFERYERRAISQLNKELRLFESHPNVEIPALSRDSR